MKIVESYLLFSCNRGQSDPYMSFLLRQATQKLTCVLVFAHVRGGGGRDMSCILANFQISERGTNERKKIKKRNIPKFPIHYYTKIAAKTGTHDKIILFFASKRGTVPPKEEQLASMELGTCLCIQDQAWP